jgi:DNA-binding NtrC family response regulator
MNILLADPDKEFVRNTLDSWQYTGAMLTAITDSSDLLSVVEDDSFAAIYLSAEFLTQQELDILSYIREHQHGVEIVILCAANEIALAESALVKGAASYLVKPLSVETIENSAKKICTRCESLQSYRLLEDHVLEDLLGQTPPMRKILRLLYKVAPTSSTILITGESGTGKEFISNIIHRLSKRSSAPFIAINCGAIPENIVESELFGVKKGAYTGAVADKKGLFEEADGGTLFLDEVAELPLSTQVKLLRFLQEQEIRRVGDSEIRKVDVRVIAATNRNVADAIKEGEFREDLFYRLNTFQMHLPPLRERKETLAHLIRFFILKHQERYEKSIQNIHPAAQVALSSYEYPGNIRELEHIIEHALVLAEGQYIRLEDLPDNVIQKTAHNTTQATGLLPLNTLAEDERSAQSEVFSEDHFTEKHPKPEDILPLSEVEKTHIIRALDAFDNNQTEAAKRLGISRSTLWRKINDHQIKI